jgi:hypothetical protein
MSANPERGSGAGGGGGDAAWGWGRGAGDGGAGGWDWQTLIGEAITIAYAVLVMIDSLYV